MAESEVAFQFLGETMNIIFFRNAYCICFLHLYLRKTFQLYYFHGYWKRHLRSRGIAECLGIYSKCMLDAGTTFSFHPCQFPHGYNDLSLLHDFLIWTSPYRKWIYVVLIALWSLGQHRTIASAAGWRVFSPIRTVWKTGNTPSIPLFSKLSAEEKSLATGSCRIVRCCLSIMRQLLL